MMTIASSPFTITLPNLAAFISSESIYNGRTNKVIKMWLLLSFTSLEFPLAECDSAADDSQRQRSGAQRLPPFLNERWQQATAAHLQSQRDGTRREIESPHSSAARRKPLWILSDDADYCAHVRAAAASKGDQWISLSAGVRTPHGLDEERASGRVGRLSTLRCPWSAGHTQ